MSAWTLRNFPFLRNTSFEDLENLPITKEYKEAPPDFPADIIYQSTGTISKKTIKLTRQDIIRAILAAGRALWCIKGEARFRNALMMGYPGLATGEISKLPSLIIAKKSISVPASQLRKYVDKIRKRAPYDVIFAPLPILIDFIKNFEDDIFEDITFILAGGDILTEYIRSMLAQRSEELQKIILPVDIYGVSECIVIANEIPPTITHEMLYTPETTVLLLRKNNGELVNIFNAKPGDRGEAVITPLFQYMVPNYPLGDLIEVTRDETEFGLPSLRVLGRLSQPVDIKLKTLGHVRGYYSMQLRVMGVVIDGYAYTNLLGKHFQTDHLTLVEEKCDKVILHTYVEKPISLEKFLEKIREDKKIGYLIADIECNVLEIELIYDPEVIREIREYYYRKYGYQVTVPKFILLCEGK